MAKEQWTYQQYSSSTGMFYPVPEDKDSYHGDPAQGITVLGVPDGYEKPILVMFRRRDEARRRCQVVAFQ